jgi:hypothetical protein
MLTIGIISFVVWFLLSIPLIIINGNYKLGEIFIGSILSGTLMTMVSIAFFLFLTTPGALFF